MNKKRLTAFEKVIIRTAELTKEAALEKTNLRIEDEDGTIVAFDNGNVLLNDGYWYERQYAPLEEIFLQPKNREIWLDYLQELLGKDCNENKQFNDWLSGKRNIPESVTYTGITQTGICAMTETRIEDDAPEPETDDFEGIKVYVLPISEVNIFFAYDKSGRFNADESATNVEKLTYADCRRILGSYTNKTTCDKYADCYSLEEFQNQINFSVENTFNNNYYIKFVKKI